MPLQEKAAQSCVLVIIALNSLLQVLGNAIFYPADEGHDCYEFTTLIPRYIIFCLNRVVLLKEHSV